MDTAILEYLLAALAAVATFCTVWYQSKNKQAGEQGDVILEQLKAMLSVGDAIAVYVPEIKRPVEDLKDIVAQIEAGWNDASFTTDQMKVLEARGLDLMIAIRTLAAK